MAQKNVTFNQVGTSNLYETGSGPESGGWLGLALPGDVAPPGKSILLANALSNKSLKASFIFSTKGPDISGTEKIKAFLSAIAGIIKKSTGSRGIIWLRDVNAIRPENSPILPLSTDGARLAANLNVPLIDGTLSVQVVSGTKLSLTQQDTVLAMGDGSSPIVTFSGPAKPITKDPVEAVLPFTGKKRGCLFYDVAIERDSLNDDLNWGFQFLAPSAGPVSNESAQWYPLASGRDPVPTDKIQFNACIDPADVLDNSTGATAFTFTGKNTNGKQTVLNSWFRTNCGNAIHLLPADPDPGETIGKPARLVVTKGTITIREQQDFHFSPDGDFIMEVENGGDNQTFDLLCGLSGTETIRFQLKTNPHSDDRIRFFAGKPAYAPVFPFDKVSMSDPVSKAELLDSTYTTAWATVVPGNGNKSLYSAQPEAGVLYSEKNGGNTKAEPHADILAPFFPAVEIPGDECFPLVPYAGLITGDKIGGEFTLGETKEFEFQIINPTRKKIISGQSPVSVPLNGDAVTAANTQGMIVNVEQNGKWDNILFAKNYTDELMFSGFGQKLQNAFQTNQQFLVISNNSNIGNFNNKISIEGWPFDINIPEKTNYGDYKNIVVFKFCNGSLEDLIKNPMSWTQAGDFNNEDELNALSQWLQEYITEAKILRQLNPLYQKFIDIITNPGWNGVLALRTDIIIEKMPVELQGLMGGIDQDKFFAHHIGIEVNKVAVDDTGTIVLKEDSSLFGLISYLDDTYKKQLEAGESPDTPVPAPPGCTYDFKVLSLQTLFENSRITDFKSKAQLTLNELFSDKVVKTITGKSTADSNSIVFNGSCQKHGSGDGGNKAPVYVFDTTALTRLCFDSNIMPYVDIAKAQFNTVQNQDGGNSEDSSKVHSRFLFWGKMGFEKLVCKEKTKEQEITVDFDIFSFGGEAGAQPGEGSVGLAFSNLFIGMDFDLETPTVKTFTFDPGEAAFDPGQSNYRNEVDNQNLYQNFSLQLNRFISGTGEKTPRDLGYLEVRMPELAAAGLSDNWYGLECSLNMGTPGELAAAAGFYSTLLIAWSPGSKGNDERYNAYMGIKLPGTEGAKIFGIQGVLKIGIAGIELFYVEKDKSFLLKLNDIALKFLGLLKLPPGSTTSFYLFGDPEGNEKGLGWYAAYNKDE